MMIYENLLTQQVEEYIEYKRSLGYQIKIEAQELKRFASYAHSIGHNGSLTTELAMQWASLNENYSLWYKARRLETIHTFAKYIYAFDPFAQIPLTGVFGKCHTRTAPHIYTDREVSLLMNEAGKLFCPDGIRSYTVAVAIGLLRSTGIRVSELTLLRNKNVRLDEGYIFINSSKFKKDRLVPIHQTTANELIRYRNFIINKLGLRSGDEYFFVSSYGKRFNTRAFEYAFRLIRPILYANDVDAKLASEPRNIRLYDFRHTFACETIKKWLENGDDANQKLYLLSTYMGHVKPEDTYWYLSATPELLAVSCRRYEAAFGEAAQYEI
jgi:integrase